MSRRNWINLFSTSQSVELSGDLERGYDAALLIQSLELEYYGCLLYTSPSPRDLGKSRMPSSA